MVSACQTKNTMIEVQPQTTITQDYNYEVHSVKNYYDCIAKTLHASLVWLCSRSYYTMRLLPKTNIINFIPIVHFVTIVEHRSVNDTSLTRKTCPVNQTFVTWSRCDSSVVYRTSFKSVRETVTSFYDSEASSEKSRRFCVKVQWRRRLAVLGDFLWDLRMSRFQAGFHIDLEQDDLITMWVYVRI